MSTSYNNQQIPTIYVGYNPNSGQPMPTAPAPIQPPLRLSWYQMQQKNKPQGNALAPGYLILAVAGAQIAWGSFQSTYGLEYFFLFPNNEYKKFFGQVFHLIVSYFVGMLIGAIMSALTVNKFEKKIFYFSSCILIIIGSILLLACSTDYDGFIAARYIIGIGVGLAFIPYIFHGSEIAVKELRGALLGGGNFLILIGMFCIAVISTIYFSTNHDVNIVNMVFGGIFIAWSVIAMLICFFATLESPVFLMQKGQYQRAKEVMMKLRNDTCETYPLNKDYTELHTMINEDMLQDGVIINDGNMKYLLIVSLLRGVYTLTLCFPVNMTTLIYLTTYMQSVDGPQVMGLTILIGCRVLTEIFSYVLIDKIPRRILLLVSGGISGIILTIAGILILKTTSLNCVAACCILYQLVVGFGFGSVSLTLMGEVFPTKKKTFSILFVIFVEVAVQLLTAYISVYNFNKTVISGNFAVAVGVIQIIVIGLVYYFLPETLKLSLAECRQKLK